MSGSGRDEYPDNSKHLSDILKAKGINHYLDIWGDDCDHCFETWIKMLRYMMETRL